MKRILLVLTLAILLLGFASPVTAATCLPPQLPSSFYGTVYNGRVGQVVTVTAGRIVSATSKTFAYQGKVVYSLDVRAYDPCAPRLGGGKEGDKLTFKIGMRIVGTSEWHGGTNTLLNLR